MAEEMIEVIIGVDGAVSMSVQGVSGMACMTQTGELVRLLGGEVEAHELTDEAYVGTEAEVENQLWG